MSSEKVTEIKALFNDAAQHVPSTLKPAYDKMVKKTVSVYELEDKIESMSHNFWTFCTSMKQLISYPLSVHSFAKAASKTPEGEIFAKDLNEKLKTFQQKYGE